MTSATDRLDALEASSARLASMARQLTPDDLTGQAYPTKWNVSDVFSHLGSGAVIMRRGVDAAVSGVPVEEGFNQSVWDSWNAKSPEAKATDALEADRALLDRIASLTDAEREAFQFSLGPFTVDLAGFLGLRLNEHVLHSWDIDVALHPNATLPGDAVGIVVDNVEMLVGFVGKSDGNEREIAIRTTNPSRDFALAVGAERLSLTPATGAGTADIELPSEAFIRLLYGRLDPTHSPPGIEGPTLDQLRAMFPGI